MHPASIHCFEPKHTAYCAPVHTHTHTEVKASFRAETMTTTKRRRIKKRNECSSVSGRHKNYFWYLSFCRRFHHLHRFSCQCAGALKFVNYLLNVFSGWDTISQLSNIFPSPSLHILMHICVYVYVWANFVRSPRIFVGFCDSKMLSL